MSLESGRVPDLAPQLAALKAEVLAARERAQALAQPLPDELWARRPGARWSVAECLEHLNLTSEHFLPVIDAALADARRQGFHGRGPFRRDLVGRLLGWLVEPPYRVRVRTTARFVPGAAAPKAEVMARFDRLQDQVLARLDAADGLAIDRVSVESPFDQRFRYNLYSAFCLIPIHQRRHLWQAERVVRALAPR